MYLEGFDRRFVFSSVDPAASTQQAHPNVPHWPHCAQPMVGESPRSGPKPETRTPGGAGCVPVLPRAQLE